MAQVSKTLLKTSDGLVILPLERMIVSRCMVDYAFTLEFQGRDDFYVIRIGQPFSIQFPQVNLTRLDPGAKTQMGSALELFGKTVQRCSVNLAGRLELSFVDGSLLTVDPSQDFEAWEFAGPAGLRAVALPGGGFSTWGAS